MWSQNNDVGKEDPRLLDVAAKGEGFADVVALVLHWSWVQCSSLDHRPSAG